MRFVCLCLLLAFLLIPVASQETATGPTTEKAQKSYKEAMDLLKQGKKDWALDKFKKADKQDDGHCQVCEKQMIHYGMDIGDWKAAELGAEELVLSLIHI